MVGTSSQESCNKHYYKHTAWVCYTRKIMQVPAAAVRSAGPGMSGTAQRWLQFGCQHGMHAGRLCARRNCNSLAAAACKCCMRTCFVPAWHEVSAQRSAALEGLHHPSRRHAQPAGLIVTCSEKRVKTPRLQCAAVPAAAAVSAHTKKRWYGP